MASRSNCGPRPVCGRNSGLPVIWVHRVRVRVRIGLARVAYTQLALTNLLELSLDIVKFVPGRVQILWSSRVCVGGGVGYGCLLYVHV